MYKLRQFFEADEVKKEKMFVFILPYCKKCVILIAIGNENKQMWFATFNP